MIRRARLIADLHRRWRRLGLTYVQRGEFEALCWDISKGRPKALVECARAVVR